MTEDKSLKQILDIGIALTAQKDPNKLLDLIVNTAMELTSADGGTLYTVSDDKLIFRIMKTKSKGLDMGKAGEEIKLPPVPVSKENICAFAAISKQALNIEDVYESELFDFSGPRRYDAMNGYRTKSMMAIPMIDNKDEVIGVMQLINAMDEKGAIRSFSQKEQQILLSLASQTAISLANMAYIQEINRQIWSFTEAMTEAIDARTPYNGSHTRKVAEYAGLIADKINEKHAAGEEELYFDAEHKDQLVMAALLHDIGKMIIPIEVMNKKSRLEHHLKNILERLENIRLRLKIDFLEEKISQDDYELWVKRVEDTRQLSEYADEAGFIPDDKMVQIKECFEYEYISPNGEIQIQFLNEAEKSCMQIQKGTLTEAERAVMESHVEMTERILSKVYFNKSFCSAPIWAAQHHECINGKGYPMGISGEKLGAEARILAVADICDALLATDRPYKKPMPKDRAFAILEDMAQEGRIEFRFVEYLKECLC